MFLSDSSFKDPVASHGKSGFSAPIRVLLGHQMTYRAETWDSGSTQLDLHMTSELDPQLERNYVFYGFFMVLTEGVVNFGPALKYVIVGY